MAFLDDLLVGVITVADEIFNGGKLKKYKNKKMKELKKDIQEQKRYMHGKTDEELIGKGTQGTLAQRHAAAEVYKSRHINQK